MAASRPQDNPLQPQGAHHVIAYGIFQALIAHYWQEQIKDNSNGLVEVLATAPPRSKLPLMLPNKFKMLKYEG